MPEGNEGNEGTTGTENDGTGSSGETELTPEQMKKELEKVRKEAAGYRTKLRETEDKLKNAKTPEDIEAAKTELVKENAKLARELLVERIGKGLPDDLIPLLTGNTEEELKAQADALKKHLPAQQQGKQKTPPGNLGGGLNAGKPGDDGFDPVKIAGLARLGRL